ncbi:MAG TPA: hypothetical protein VN133_12630 [Humibacter sp.]|nr:hypothetical protein [Humibacter sp.]
MAQHTKAPIIGFSVVLDDEWHPVPMTPGDGEPWASRLTAESGVEQPAAQTLVGELVRLQRNFAALITDACSAFVWVPAPASGYCGGSFVGMNWPLGDDGFEDAESFIARFAQGGFIDPGDTVLDQRVWSGEFDAGPFAAVHRVSSVPSGDDEMVLESVEFAVFPPGADEFIHLAFAAESIAAFDDMPAQTQAIAQTLQVTLGTSR